MVKWNFLGSLYFENTRKNFESNLTSQLSSSSNLKLSNELLKGGEESMSLPDKAIFFIDWNILLLVRLIVVVCQKVVLTFAGTVEYDAMYRYRLDEKTMLKMLTKKERKFKINQICDKNGEEASWNLQIYMSGAGGGRGDGSPLRYC